MPPAKNFAAIAIAILCAGCAVPTRERAVAIATGEIANRKLLLPEDYTVHIRDVVSVVEFEPAHKLWEIEFRGAGRRELLYTATVDQDHRSVVDFTDHHSDRNPAKRP
jgi:hypothetical protein